MSARTGGRQRREGGVLSGDQAASGGTGNTAPALSHRVEYPWHPQAVIAVTHLTDIPIGAESPFAVAADLWTQQQDFAIVSSHSRSLAVFQPWAAELSAGLSAYAGGSTLCSRAQAQRCSTVKQQQCDQHCSAVWQPQA